MKIYRFRHKNKILYGVLKEEALHPLSGSIFKKLGMEKRGIPIGTVALLPPIVPTKIVAVGTNYRPHASEMGRPLPPEPLLFLKPPSALIGPLGKIIYPPTATRVDYEGELAVIIKKEARRLGSQSEAAEYILGYACFNDITARDLQARDVQFTRAKSFDTFAALGPCIATGLDPSGLRLKTFLNGKLKQSANTRDMIFSVPELVRFISNVMTLYPGDVVATGTPAGVGPMAPGDRVDVQVEGVGTLSNIVVRLKT